MLICIHKKSLLTAPYFGLSSRGNPIILAGQHRFIKERERGLKTRWVCVKKRTQRCTAFITTLEKTIVKLVADHNH